MSYCIKYDPKLGKRYPVRRKNNSGIYQILIGSLLFCVIVYGLHTFNIGRYLIPGNPETTIKATSAFFDDIKSGTGWADAFSVFCETVIENDAP